MRTYVVRLRFTARDPLVRLVTTGRAAAVKRLRARLLLNADGAVGERRWTDADLAAAWDTSASTGHRVRQAGGEQGLDAACVRRRPPGRPYGPRDGAQEAQRIAGAGRPAPEGRTRWTLAVLADRGGACGIGAPIRAECGRPTRQQTRSNRGRTHRG